MSTRISIIGLLIMLSVTATWAQNSPKELGTMVFKAFQSQKLGALDRHVPQPDQAIKIANALGINRTKEETAIFKEKYPSEVRQFKNRCDDILERGSARGINWSAITLEKVEIVEKVVHVSETEPDKTITSTYVDIIFNSKDRKFRIELTTVFELDGIWYLGGDRIEIEEIN